VIEAIQSISRMQGVGRASAISADSAATATSSAASAGFGDLLGRALDGLNQTAANSDGLAEAFSAGADVEIHDVVLAMQETQIAFEFATQVRNRAIEAYQEIMRLQL